MKPNETLQALIDTWESRKAGATPPCSPSTPGLLTATRIEDKADSPEQNGGLATPGPSGMTEGSMDETASLLEKIIVEVAAPIVRRTIRYRLHFYINERGISSANPDAEDLYHDILARLVVALQRLAAGSASPLIADFSQYVQRVAINGCNDYLRLKYPQRTRLRDRLRDLLQRRPEFALWRGGDGEALCGLAEWSEHGLTSVDTRRLALVAESADSTHLLIGGQIRAAPLAGLLAEIFQQLGGPIIFESLVATTAIRLGLTEYRLESLDSEPDSEEGAGSRSLATRLSSGNRALVGRAGTSQRNAGQRNVGQRNAGQSNAGQSNAGQSNAGQSNVGQTNVGQMNEGQMYVGQIYVGWMGADCWEDGTLGLERQIDEQIALRRMWEVWLTLPPRPRDTFFYSFSTSRGEDLLTLLFEAGVTAPGEVASVLGLTIEELVTNWKRMPMRNAELAEMWGVPRQQVNKWRFQALRMIEKRLT